MTDPLSGELAVQIRAEMLRQNLTYDDLAARAGVPISTLRARLSAPKGMRIEHAQQLAEALGMSTSTLIARAERAAA